MTTDRRMRMKSGVAAVLLCLLIGVPSSLGMAFFVSIRAPTGSRWIAAAKLEDIPESGMPQLIMVDVPRENIWQLDTADTRTVYAQRSNGNVTAFDSHFRYDMRLPIIYDADRDVFKTSCWELEFARDGSGRERNGNQPMNLHRVEARVADGELLLRF